MASICSAAPWYWPPLPAPGSRRPSNRGGIPSFALPKPGPTPSHHAPLTPRFGDAISIRLQKQQRLSTAFASNSNPSGGESTKNDADGTAAPRGPPLATILAGLLVFLLVCWLFGSFILWLFSLVVKVPPQ